MYASFGQDYQTLPSGIDVLVPAGTPLFVQTGADATDTSAGSGWRRAVIQDTFHVVLPEPVDALYEEAPAPAPAPAAVPTVVVQAADATKEDTEARAWYKSPAFVGGVLSVLAFSVVAFLQSRVEAKIK